MSKKHEASTSYRLIRKYVIWVLKHYYDEYIVLNEENIPVDEPIIFAPNHLNALMDAMAIISLPPHEKAKSFLARADLFNLARPIVKFLHFAKLIPAYRIRDGYENLDKNKTSFDAADNVLINNGTLVIMPEGNQGDEKKIRPLVKGIFRIAFSAQQKMPVGKSLKIVPVGIDMGHLIKCGKHIIIQVGKPIDMALFMPLYEENQVEAMNQIKMRLKNDMENLIQNLATDKYYACFETAIEVMETDMLKRLQVADNTVNRFYAGQKTAKLLIELEAHHPQEIEQLDSLCQSYREGLKKVNLRTSNLELSKEEIPSPLFNFLSNFMYILVGLPGFILNILPFKIPTLFVKILKIEYKGFYSSVYYAVSLISFPLMYSLQSLLILMSLALPWWIFILLLPIHYYSGKISFLLYRKIKANLAKQRLLKLIKSKNEDYQQLKNLQSQIKELIAIQLQR